MRKGIVDYLSFQLPSQFVNGYRDRTPDWGYPIGGGNSLGELTYLTRYSRRMLDGRRERWVDTCERVINGMFSILRDHCNRHKTPWDPDKNLRTATDAFERMFNFKWLPPGRGLWAMGTEFVHGSHNSAALQNCAFISTRGIRDDRVATLPFVRLMEMSMLGVGVGFDTLGAGERAVHLVEPEGGETFVIPDSREGWCESVDKLLSSWFFGTGDMKFDYSKIRAAGSPIKGFGGVAQGPGLLRELHSRLNRVLFSRVGERIDSRLICDIMNLIGKCVVAGNVRRSSEIALGESTDTDFLTLKDYRINPDRMGKNGWGNLSNNSVLASVGEDYSHLVDGMVLNGEPGLFYLDLAQRYGRLVDPPNDLDWRAAGTNPCGEQTLESYECCTLVETFPVRNDDVSDFCQTLKIAYLYGKAVTLLPTHWEETNEVMRRNRRIGCSVSGEVMAAERWGWPGLFKMLNTGYEVIQERDARYSDWLGERPSIKTTSVKPSGTVSLLAGVTPGVHWPVADNYIRRMRLAASDPLGITIAEAGYHVEPDVMDPRSVVVSLPTTGADVRPEREVSVWEKAALAVGHQRHWADNQVSVTLTFKPEEVDQIEPLIRAYDGCLKSVSLLPLSEESSYLQMPYERLPKGQIEEAQELVQPINWKRLYDGDSVDPKAEMGCDNDTCATDL